MTRVSVLGAAAPAETTRVLTMGPCDGSRSEGAAFFAGAAAGTFFGAAGFLAVAFAGVAGFFAGTAFFGPVALDAAFVVAAFLDAAMLTSPVCLDSVLRV